MNLKITGLFILNAIAIHSNVFSQVINSNDSTPESWQLHFQQTVITQHHGTFSSPYSGLKSLSAEKETNTSLTTTLYFGKTLWKGGAIYFNPELAGGSGFSGATGIAGFTNGETYRVGDPAPTPYVARIYFEQYFNQGGGKRRLESEANQLRRDVDSSGIRIVAGKFCLADFFDDNSYSHDPRSQFMNWSLMSTGAWDYPANTRGYTLGLMVEMTRAKWALRFAAALVPKEANGPDLDFNVGKAHGLVLEYDRHYTLSSKPGTLRVLAYNNLANMGSYSETVSNPDYLSDVTQTRKYSRTKFGFGINFEQELTKHLGMFGRASWNDGKNETWCYTEIDQSLNLGASLHEFCSKRPDDVLSLALVVNGISNDHRNYIASGGYGFIIGDGILPRYGREMIFESYYLFQIGKYFQFSPDYQFVMNPAYNKDRGPVNVIGIRVHIEI